MKKLGPEAAALQAQLIKELANLKAQGSFSNVLKRVLLDIKNAHREMFVPDGSGNDDSKKKGSSTGDLVDDTTPPTPQKNVGDSSSNVYSQPYTQNFDNDANADDKVQSQDDAKVDWFTASKPSGERAGVSQDDSIVGLSTVSKSSGEMFRGVARQFKDCSAQGK